MPGAGNVVWPLKVSAQYLISSKSLCIVVVWMADYVMLKGKHHLVSNTVTSIYYTDTMIFSEQLLTCMLSLNSISERTRHKERKGSKRFNKNTK